MSLRVHVYPTVIDHSCAKKASEAGLSVICILAPCSPPVRPPMKTYTDLRVECEEVHAAGGVGLEPVFAQVREWCVFLLPSWCM